MFLCLKIILHLPANIARWPPLLWLLMAADRSVRRPHYINTDVDYDERQFDARASETHPPPPKKTIFPNTLSHL